MLLQRLRVFEEYWLSRSTTSQVDGSTTMPEEGDPGEPKISDDLDGTPVDASLVRKRARKVVSAHRRVRQVRLQHRTMQDSHKNRVTLGRNQSASVPMTSIEAPRWSCLETPVHDAPAAGSLENEAPGRAFGLLCSRRFEATMKIWMVSQ